MEFSHIKAVTFDAGGTLIEPWPSVGHVYSAVAAELGYAVLPPEKLNEAFARAWKLKQNFDYSMPAWFALVEQVFVPQLSTALSQKLFESLYQRFTDSAVWHVYDDVQSTLKALRERGYRLAVVSNWDDRLKKLLNDLQLSDYFESIVLSIDVGVAKPCPKIFHHTLSVLNLPATAVLHVGDSVDEDLIGPQQSRIPALLLDRTRRSAVQAPGSSIPSLRDLLALLPGPV